MTKHTADLEITRESFRRHVLDALDAAARETFNPSRNDAGASDADLPRLFKAIDAQIEVLAERYCIKLIDAA
jgi:hypothetical protein